MALDRVSNELALVWLDIETTGLDKKADKILEIGMRATNWWGRELSRFTSVVVEDGWYSRLLLNSYVFDMHTKNGLVHMISDVDTAGHREKFNPVAVEARAVEWLVGLNLPEGKDKLPISGSTAAFDRAFCCERLIDLDHFFSHRTHDVSAIREAMRVINPPVFEGRLTLKPKETHRVQDCIDDSIALWQYEIENFLWEVD
jgi:oligoribonuclease